MTIWFSTNIPEMRAISTFNRVSTDIGEIQRRITTGQRINSGKDDPGGLIIREGLRADIKEINAMQSNMKQAEILTDTAADGMMQLLEILRGDPGNSSDNGLLGVLYDTSTSDTEKVALAADYLKLYDAAVSTTLYNGEKLIGGDLATTGKTYQLGGGKTLGVTIADLSSDKIENTTDITPTGGTLGTFALATLLTLTDGDSTPKPIALTDVQKGVREIADTISKEIGKLGNSQNIVSQNQKLLSSRLTSVTASEGKISNADIAAESSRMARAELLAQNSMNSVMYSRSYAAFAVSSLFG